ncbi:oxidoreductase, partial [Streptomyces sp. 4F]
MLEPAYQADVVVVGAGIAGLAAAHRLTAHAVGGRLATEKVDGFRLDRIGQPLSTACPELRLTPGLDGLALLPFAPGVLLHSEGRHHRAGVPAGARGARGALHAVRALASAPRSVPAPRRPVSVARTPKRPVPASRARAGAPLGTAVDQARLGAGAPLGTAVDQARLGAALTRLAGTPVERLLARPELSAAQALAVRGLPARTIDGFLRPLLAALL